MLHGPASGYGWSEADAEVWEAMRKERVAGRTRLLGLSNVSLKHLEEVEASRAEMPVFVQNRCFARLGWDREVREFCNEHNIVYQGFSLLTANPEVLEHRPFCGGGERSQCNSGPGCIWLCAGGQDGASYGNIER